MLLSRWFLSTIPYHARCTTNHLTLIASHLTSPFTITSIVSNAIHSQHVTTSYSQNPLFISLISHIKPPSNAQSPLLSSPLRKPLSPSLSLTAQHTDQRDNILMAACSETRLACKPYGLCYCFVIHLSHLGQEKRGQE